MLPHRSQQKSRYWPDATKPTTKVKIKIIPHSEQRYDTCGDWEFIDGTLFIRVSDSGNPKMNFLVAHHEYTEAMLCFFNGVTTKDVDNYDFKHPESGGDDFSLCPDAPYHTYHNDALSIEWLLSRILNVNWEIYSKVLNKMGWKLSGKWKKNKKENK